MVNTRRSFITPCSYIQTQQLLSVVTLQTSVLRSALSFLAEGACRAAFCATYMICIIAHSRPPTRSFSERSFQKLSSGLNRVTLCATYHHSLLYTMVRITSIIFLQFSLSVIFERRSIPARFTTFCVVQSLPFYVRIVLDSFYFIFLQAFYYPGPAFLSPPTAGQSKGHLHNKKQANNKSRLVFSGKQEN